MSERPLRSNEVLQEGHWGKKAITDGGWPPTQSLFPERRCSHTHQHPDKNPVIICSRVLGRLGTFGCGVLRIA